MRRPPILRNAIRAALAAGPAIGMTHGDLMPVIGVSTRMLAATLSQMVQEGLLFGYGEAKRRRYFVSSEALSVAMPALVEYFAGLDEKRKEAYRAYRREKARRQRARKREAAPAKPPKAVAPPKQRKPHHRQRAIVITPPKRISPSQAWAQAEPVIPPTLQIKRLPGYTGDRWNVQPPSDGFARLGIGRYLEAA